jgi:hypothetical protein
MPALPSRKDRVNKDAKFNWLMLLKEIIPVYNVSIQNTYIQRGELLIVEAYATYCYHSYLNC